MQYSGKNSASLRVSLISIRNRKQTLAIDKLSVLVVFCQWISIDSRKSL